MAKNITNPYVSPIAQPLASPELRKAAIALILAAAPQKHVALGLKEVQKKIASHADGLVFLAADTFPVDVLAHVPMLCQQEAIKYVWLPTKADMGGATGVGRAISVLFVDSRAGKEGDAAKLYKEVVALMPEAKILE